MVGGTGMAVAHASTAAPTEIYVDNTNSSCNDGGTGTQAAPFCTLQAAFTAVQAGQTVQVVAGDYTRPGTLSTSGTASAPIIVQFGKAGQPYNDDTSPTISLPQGTTGSAITLSGASYVDLYDIGVFTNQDTAPAVAVQNSSNVLITGASLASTATGGGIAVSGTGSGVTIERNSFATAGDAVEVTGAGATGTVVTTNVVTGASSADGSGGVAVDGATGTDVVSNTISETCTSGISVSGDATGTVIENNVVEGDEFATTQCPSTATTALGLNVASDSTSGTTEKYDTIGEYEATPVEWAGTAYTTAAAYQAASGQGSNDILLTGTAAAGPTLPAADYADSADALAPGELSTDYYGNARVDDPQVPNTGTGVGYYDRGAVEVEDDFQAQLSQAVNSGALGVSVSFIVGLCGWSTSYTGTINWGDGQSTAESGSGCTYEGGGASHSYAKPGAYTITFDATDGYTPRTSTSDFVTEGTDYTAYGPTRILDTRKGIGGYSYPVIVGSYVRLKIAGNGGIPANVSAVELNITVTNTGATGYVGTSPDGDGTPTATAVSFVYGQTVADSALVQVANDGYVDIYLEGGSGAADLVADVSGYFTPTAASGYQPVALSRILDTRKGIGAPVKTVPSAAGIPVTVSGVDSIPTSGVTAVAVHVTVADTAGSGWIGAEPDGAGVPGTSILNYTKGQVVSNTVLVPVASDGKIELYNGGSGTVDLLADVSGYFSAAAPNAFVTVTPYEPVDTANSGGPLAANSTSHYLLDQATGTAAVIGTITASAPTDSGYITAYPDNVSRPAISDVNFNTGQTVSNLSMLDTATDEGAATYVFNGSPGTTQLDIDVLGYFTAN
jgi:hypothetical protein